MSIKKKLKDKAIKSLKKKVMGDQKKEKQQDQRGKHADTIIRNHVIWSMGAGLIPILIADIFAVSALQLDMIRQLSRAYDLDFSETQGKALVTSLTGTTLARLTAGSVVKLVPGLGSLVGGAAVSVFAGASTYALGEVFKKHFESGGTILDFDPSRLKKMYKEKFEKGKKVAKDLKKNNTEATVEEINKNEEIITDNYLEVDQPSTKIEADNMPPDLLTQLGKLAKLKEQGILTEEEFDEMKKKIIKRFE